MLGEDEIGEGVVSLKDMQSGEQVKLTPAEAGERIRRSVEQRNQSTVIRE